MSGFDAFSGPTAAAIWKLPMPLRYTRDSRLHLTCGGAGRIRRPGVVVHRRAGSRPTTQRGRPVLDPADTWLSLGAALSPWDLTAVADRLVTGTLTTAPLSSVAELTERLAKAGRFPGVTNVRAALMDVRFGAWSRPETLLRLLLLRAGLPELDLNVPIALEDGRTAYPDLAWPQFRIAIEYDGRLHDASGQKHSDADRHERVTDIGWWVVRVRAQELFDEPSAVVGRMMRRLTTRGAELSAVQWARMPRFEP